MKPKVFVILLACVSLALIGGIVSLKRSAPPVSVAKMEDTSSQLTEQAKKPPEAVMHPATISQPELRPFRWQEVESEDYKEYIAHLREIGCPERTIRDIVIADIDKLYAEREAPLKDSQKKLAKAGTQELEAAQLENLRQLREIQLEKRSVIKELLGIDIPIDLLPSTGKRDYNSYEVALGTVPQEKRDAVQFLQENYWRQSDALKANYDNKRTPEFVAEYRHLNDSLRDELAKILTPQELEDYDIRTSSTAKSLGTKLAAHFQPTEDEFRNIFRAVRDYEDRVGRIDNGSTPEDRLAAQQERAAAAEQRDQQLRASLGEDRYKEYQLNQERNYELLSRLGLRYGLPKETVMEAYELQKSYQNMPQEPPIIDAGAQGTQPPLNQAQASSQLNDQMTALLGERAAAAYRRVNGGALKASFAGQSNRRLDSAVQVRVGAEQAQ